MEPIQRQLSSLLRESWQLIHARRVCNVDRSNPDGSGFGCKHLEMKDWPVERGIDRSNSVRAPLTYSFDLGSEWRAHMIGRSMPDNVDESKPNNSESDSYGPSGSGNPVCAQFGRYDHKRRAPQR